MKNLILIFVAFSIFSCEKVETHYGVDYEVYSISRHKSQYDIEKISSKEISGTAFFSQSCEYVLDKNVGQINKLIGLSNGSNHHQNSIRIGWEYDTDHFTLYAYWYIDGVRDQHVITSVVTEEVFEYEVKITESEYFVSVNDTEMSIPHDEELKETYLLYPYFGGEEPFPGSIHGDDECLIYLSQK